MLLWFYIEFAGTKGWRIQSMEVGNSNWIFIPLGGCFDNYYWPGAGRYNSSTFKKETDLAYAKNIVLQCCSDDQANKANNPNQLYEMTTFNQGYPVRPVSDK